MKPSIHIDLPGWCTLQRQSSGGDDEPEDDIGGDRSTMDLDDLEDADAKSVGNSSSKSGGNFRDDLDSDEDDDGDGSIARLFSIEGLKRRRSDGESQLEAAKNDQAESARAQRQRQSYQAAKVSAALDLRAEAYLDWQCVRCTFINTHDQATCQGCGGKNLRRKRRLRERRKEVERLERLQSARETRDRSLKEDALKDVLEDSDSDGEGCTAHDPDAMDEPGMTQPTVSSTTSQYPDASDSPASPRVEAAPAVSTNKSGESKGKGKGNQDSVPLQCFVETLPPDLLLQCAEFLGDVTTLSRLREVSMGWLIALDGQEAGRRLWRPVFYRLRASGSIHAATDSKGEQHPKLKVYDLGTLTPNTRGAASCSTPANGRSSADAGKLTPSSATVGPSPVGQSLNTEASLERVNASGSETGAAHASVSGNPNLRRSSACLVCGLIQRAGFTGGDCEMCASSLMVLPGAPATPRVAYTKVNLSGGSGDGSSASAISGSAPSSTSVGAGVSATSKVGVAGVSVGEGSCSTGEEGTEEDGGGDDVDWHFLVKRLAEEKRIASRWGSLRHGWIWLQKAIQGMLRRRRGDEPNLSAAPSVEQAGLDCPAQNGNGGRGARNREDRLSSSSLSAQHNGDGGLGDLDPTIARLIRKLTSKKWVLLYDSLKATFTLQAQGVAREVVFAAQTFAANAAAMDAASTGNGARKAERVAAQLEGLRGCITAWEAYREWCEEIDMYCELLNEQISAERYRTAGAGCGRGDSTPYIRDTALLSFRHSFALNVQICSILRASVARGASLVEPDSALVFRNPAKHVPCSESQGARSLDAKSSGQRSSSGGTGAASTGTDELFTDQELMEDSRAINFSIGRSCSGHGGEAGGGSGKRRGDARTRGSSSSGVFRDHPSTNVNGSRSLAMAVTSKRRGHYYDWFLSKLEGKEAGIIRGDVDARGKSLLPSAGDLRGAGFGAGGAESREAGVGGHGEGEGVGVASFRELLHLAVDMIEELDVPDDHLSRERHTQGAMRRLLLLPIKRWQALSVEATEDEPNNLLMAGLSPAPGKEGFHRLRSGAAGRRKGTPPLSTLGKDAGKSWEKLSSFFG